MDRQSVEAQVRKYVIVSTALRHPILLYSSGVVELTECHQIVNHHVYHVLVSYLDR